MDTRTPEQIQAEAKAAEENARLEAEQKAAEEEQARIDARRAEEQARIDGEAEALNAKKAAAGELHFVFGNRVFVPTMPRVNIPGLGLRTKLEICVDEEAQAYLVNENAIGTVIIEIL